MPGPGRGARVSESHQSPLCRQRGHSGELSIIGKTVHQRPGHSSESDLMHGVQINQNRQHFTGEEGGQEASSFTVTPILVVRLDSVGGAQAQGPPTFCGALSTGLRLPEARRLCCPGRTPTKEPGPGGIGSPPPVKCYRPEGRRPFLKGAGAKSTAGWGAPISIHGQRRGAANLGERGSHCGGAGLGGEHGRQPQHETKTGPPPPPPTPALTTRLTPNPTVAMERC